MPKPRVGIVVQRYGLEVNGGAENHCRLLAENMSEIWDIDVLTTCAKDYLTWKNYFQSGRQTINGVSVLRFPVTRPRDMEKFNKWYRFIDQFRRIRERMQCLEKGRLSFRKFLMRWVLLLFDRTPLRFYAEGRWMRLQGPLSHDLQDFLLKSYRKYDLFIFFSFQYATTYFGLPLVKDKALLIPTAHDDPPSISLSIYRKLMSQVKGIIFNTVEEKDLILKYFPFTDAVPSEVVGIGVDSVEPLKQDQGVDCYQPLPPRYLVYVGRITDSKGCGEMFSTFIDFCRNHPSCDLKLILVGEAFMEVPKHPAIISLGFLSNEKRDLIISRSIALWMPSKQESLSMVLLEAWVLNTPVIVHKDCQVLVGQCKRSGGGLAVDQNTFGITLDKLLAQPELRASLALSGKRYVQETYSWERIKGLLHAFIGQFLNESSVLTKNKAVF